MVSEVTLIPSPKAPSEVREYRLDYRQSVPDGDAIAASAWTVPSGTVRIGDGIDADNHATVITVSGGTLGADYLLENNVTTVNGLQLAGFLMLRLRQPGETAAPVATRYAGTADMVARFGERIMVELTDTGPAPSGQVDAVVASQALADADALIDGYIGSRYTLPLATVPELLKVIACDLARYRLMGERPIEEVRQRYEDATAWLGKIAEGKYGLGLDSSNETVPEGDDGPQTHANRRVFDKRKLHEYLHGPHGGMFY